MIYHHSFNRLLKAIVAFILLSFILISHLTGQILYPVKVYRTMDDFEKGSFIDTVAYRRNESLPKKLNYKDTIVNNVIFKTKDHRKFQNSFAVECQGELYFQIRFILKNRMKGDKVRTVNGQHITYVRVDKKGDNYYYLESDTANTWNLALANNLGVVGAAIHPSLYNLTGIVYLSDIKKFDVIRNCEDFNQFVIMYLTNKYPTNCIDNTFSIKTVRRYLKDVKELHY